MTERIAIPHETAVLMGAWARALASADDAPEVHATRDVAEWLVANGHSDLALAETEVLWGVALAAAHDKIGDDRAVAEAESIVEAEARREDS